MMTICRALEKHADDILKILQPHIESGIILPRDKKDILKAIHTFFVAETDGTTTGCLSVKDYGNGLLEIRSFAVDGKYLNLGIGTALLKYVVNHISESKSGKRIFALTLRPRVFQNAGFKITEIGRAHV